MNTQTIIQPVETGLWKKFWLWMAAVDEAVHHDPSEVLHRRIANLETRLGSLEATAATGGVQKK